MRIRATGHIGIGTPAPDTQVNINSSAPDAPAVVAIANKNADTRLGLWSGFSTGANPPAIIYTHALRFGTVSAAPFAIGNDFSEAMRITSGGNVGLGRPDPAVKLDVAPNAAIRVGNAYISSGHDTDANFAYNAWYNGTAWQIPNTTRKSSLLQCADGELIIYQTQTAGQPDWVRQVDIQSGGAIHVSGNVGIGITNPRAKLDIFSGFDTDVLVFGRSAGDYHSITTSFHGENTVLNYLGFNVEHNTSDIRRVLTLRGDGHVGIGTTTPGFQLDVNGPINGSNISGTSDERLKTNVMQLTDVLEKLEKIRGVSFEWNGLCECLGHSRGHQELGVIAQEVETVFPELVTAWGDESYRSVNYGGLTAVLVEAIKDLKTKNEALEQRIELIDRTIRSNNKW
jgi:hypothetical protein